MYRLAANVDNQVRIVEAGVLPPLISLAKSPDLDCKRCAAMTLCNLATNVDNQAHIVREAGLPPIIALLESVSVECRR